MYRNILNLMLIPLVNHGSFLFCFLLLLLCWVGVHCGIYKSYYNVSNLNWHPVPFSFISFSPHSWNSFNRYHFSICIHVYTIFPLYSSSHTLSPLLSCIQAGPILPSCSYSEIYYLSICLELFSYSSFKVSFFANLHFLISFDPFCNEFCKGRDIEV
jgi:hypothetical protein